MLLPESTSINGITALASALTTALVPLLPYLLKAGEKAAEEFGMGQIALVQTEAEVEATREALEAAQEIAQDPDYQDAQAAFRRQLRKLLTEDHSLAEEVSRWLEQGEPTNT